MARSANRHPVELPRPMYEQLKAIAAQRRQPVAVLVQIAVEEWLRRVPPDGAPTALPDLR